MDEEYRRIHDLDEFLNDLYPNRNNNHDELISSFLEIAVGHNIETAREFLQITNWNLHRATDLFLQNNSHYSSMNQNDQVAAAAPSIDDIWSHPETSIASSDEVSEASDSSLSSLFRPPHGLLFEGSFEEAKSVSSRKNIWLLVNLQSRTEFASHCLNRDVWSNETVRKTVESNFMLLQVYDHTVEGNKVCSFYKIDSLVPPVVLLVDPVTGQKMCMWSGVIEAESFVEGLMKFKDGGPHEHIASLMRNTQLRTKDTCLSSNNIDKVPVPSWAEEFEKEDAFLSNNEDEDEDEDAYEYEYEYEDEGTFPEFPDLTEEPKGDCDRSLVCNLCVRFPDGRRKQRKFLKSEPVQLLWSFCYSHIESTRNVFKLLQAIPGASRTLDYEDVATFDQAGLDNSMITVTWE